MCFWIKGIKRLIRSSRDEESIYFSSELEYNNVTNSYVIQGRNRVHIISLTSYAQYNCKHDIIEVQFFNALINYHGEEFHTEIEIRSDHKGFEFYNGRQSCTIFHGELYFQRPNGEKICFVLTESSAVTFFIHPLNFSQFLEQMYLYKQHTHTNTTPQWADAIISKYETFLSAEIYSDNENAEVQYAHTL